MAAIEPPTLTDGDLTLRPKRATDVDGLVRACQDPEIPRWTRVPSPYTRRHALEFLAVSEAEAEAGRTVGLVAVDASDRLLASLSLMDIDPGRTYGEIGYWVAADARGGGVATRGVELLRDWGHAALGLALIEILAHRENLASIRVAERAGFTPTGELRAAPRMDDERPVYRVFASSRA